MKAIWAILAAGLGVLAAPAAQAGMCSGDYGLRSTNVKISYMDDDREATLPATQLCANRIKERGADYVKFTDSRTGQDYQIMSEYVWLTDKTSAITAFSAGAQIFNYKDEGMTPASLRPVVPAGHGIEVVSSFSDDKNIPWKLFVYDQKLYAVKTQNVILAPICPAVQKIAGPGSYDSTMTTGSGGKNAGSGCIATRDLTPSDVLQ